MSIWIKRLAWISVALLLLAGAGRAWMSRQTKAQDAQQAAARLKAPPVFELSESDTVRATRGVLTQTLVVSGTLKAYQSAVIKARVAGELQGLTVRDGDRVKAGQVLARIDTTEYNARVQQARQQAQAASAQVDIARRTLDNNQALVAQGFISKTALDTSLASLEAAQANQRAAVAAQDIAQKALSDTSLRSPINGQVAARMVQNGERVSVDARLLEVVDLSVLELEAALAPADAAQVAVGQAATIQVEGMTQTLGARVVRISPSAQTASRTVLTYLRLDTAKDGPAPNGGSHLGSGIGGGMGNTAGSTSSNTSSNGSSGLKQGGFASGRVVVGQQAGVLVPATAVRNDKPQPYVQQVVSQADGSRVVHTPVRVVARGTADGPDNRPLAAVEGIATGALLIGARAGLIQDGTAVAVSGKKALTGLAAPSPALAVTPAPKP